MATGSSYFWNADPECLEWLRKYSEDTGVPISKCLNQAVNKLRAVEQGSMVLSGGFSVSGCMVVVYMGGKANG